MSADSDMAAISIGVVLGDYDKENRAWDRSVTTIMKQVMQSRAGVVSPLCVNVVYHLDGKLAPNEFEGVRAGRFNKKNAHLKVQVAVPRGPVEDRRAVLMDLLEAAIDEAEVFARKRRIADDLGEIRGVIERLSTE